MNRDIKAMPTTGLSFYSVVEKRRTVRSFENKAIEWDKLQRIIQAGMKAPSYNHMREWHFIFIKDSSKRQEILEFGEAFSRVSDLQFLVDTLDKITNSYQRRVYQYSVPVQGRILLQAPEVLVVCFHMAKPLSKCNSLFELNNFASAWLVVENILLAMAAEGLFGVTMVPFRTSAVKKLLNVPVDFEIATFIALGYPKKEPVLEQIRIKLEKRIHLNTW